MTYKIPMPEDYELIQSGYYNNGANICFDCEKACGGCPWSEVDLTTGKVKFQTVPGWKTVKKIRRTNGVPEVVNQIVGCPLFERTPDRRVNSV